MVKFEEDDRETYELVKDVLLKFIGDAGRVIKDRLQSEPDTGRFSPLIRGPDRCPWIL